MLTLNIPTCPYIDKEKAAEVGTKYFCDYDGMGFDSMFAHCKYCEMFCAVMKRGTAELRKAEKEAQRHEN